MSGSKKHPLEIFRENSQRLGPQTDSPASTTSPPPPAAPAPVSTSSRPRLPVEEFEIRLKLPGALLVLFAFVVGMAVSHMYGHHRGAQSVLGEVDAAALERGRQIEESSGSSTSSGSGAATSEAWYGVVAVTYGSGQERLLDETEKTLRDRYGFRDFYPWEVGDKFELFLGASRDRRDPRLKEIERRLRLIDDYPNQPGEPFASAMIKKHPADPTDPDNIGG